MAVPETGKSDPQPDVSEVRCPVELRIGRLGELRETLLGVLARPSRVRLCADAVEVVDTTGVQLLIAFVRDAKVAGVSVEWSGVSSRMAEVVDVLGAAGKLGLRLESLLVPEPS